MILLKRRLIGKMSKNCIRCVTNERSRNSLYCELCLRLGEGVVKPEQVEAFEKDVEVILKEEAERSLLNVEQTERRKQNNGKTERYSEGRSG